MRRIILGFLLFLTVVINAQIKFENGYIISNNGTKQDVLIKNLAWVDNPNQITYKSSEDSKELHASPADIKEFKVDGFQKYISYDGPIEQSSYDLSNLSDDKEPVFKNDKVFLKEITSGNYKLYFYSSKRLLKFFFGSDSNIEPLVYKKYHPAGIQSQVATNEQYKTQLKSLFSTNEEAVKLIEKSRYTEESLKKVFYATGSATDNADFTKSDKKLDFNLNIRPGVNFYAPIALSKINGAEDFPSTVSFRAGIEAEVIFPFNKYKWSVIFEPNYSSYSTKKVNTPVENGLYNMSFDSYSFINLPIGIRHYMYISDKSSVFVNASISLLTLKTGKAENIELDYNGNIYDSFPLSKSLSAKSLGFGVGFNYNKKYMAEFRVNTKYNILDKSRTPEADLSYFTFIVGYNLF